MYRKRQRDEVNSAVVLASTQPQSLPCQVGPPDESSGGEQLDTRTTNNIPVPTLAGGVVCGSPPRSSNMADGLVLMQAARDGPASDVPTLLRGNP